MGECVDDPPETLGLCDRPPVCERLLLLLLLLLLSRGHLVPVLRHCHGIHLRGVVWDRRMK